MIAKINAVFGGKPLMIRSMVVLSCFFIHLVYKYNNNTMGRIAGQPNKLTTEVKDKLQTVLDEKIQSKTLNFTPHPFKINLFSFWRRASEMVI